MKYFLLLVHHYVDQRPCLSLVIPPCCDCSPQSVFNEHSDDHSIVLAHRFGQKSWNITMKGETQLVRVVLD